MLLARIAPHSGSLDPNGLCPSHEIDTSWRLTGPRTMASLFNSVVRKLACDLLEASSKTHFAGINYDGRSETPVSQNLRSRVASILFAVLRSGE